MEEGKKMKSLGAIDEYSFIRMIGKGAYGKALLVEQKGSKKERFVMKVVDLRGADNSVVKRAAAEAELLIRLEHPYVVQHRESFIDKDALHIVMHFCEGGDLHGLIVKQAKKKQYFEEEHILRWTAQILMAVKFFHSKKVIHRDLKSQNLFLEADQRIRVGDFGISRPLESTLALAKTFIGTPLYLSPEQCSGVPYGPPTDIWAVGCVIYELCCLKVPFADSRSIPELNGKIIGSPIPPIPGQYSRELQELVDGALQKDPAKRLTAADLLRKNILQTTIKTLLEESKKKKENCKAIDINKNDRDAKDPKDKAFSNNKSVNPNRPDPTAASCPSSIPGISPAPTSGTSRNGCISSAKSASNSPDTTSSASKAPDTTSSASKSPGITSSASKSPGITSSASKSPGVTSSASKSPGVTSSANKSSGTTSSPSKPSDTASSASRSAGNTSSANKSSGNTSCSDKSPNTTSSSNKFRDCTSRADKSPSTTSTSTKSSGTTSKKFISGKNSNTTSTTNTPQMSTQYESSKSRHDCQKSSLQTSYDEQSGFSSVSCEKKSINNVEQINSRYKTAHGNLPQQCSQGTSMKTPRSLESSRLCESAMKITSPQKEALQKPRLEMHNIDDTKKYYTCEKKKHSQKTEVLSCHE